MIISRDRQFVFAHIPKTGGTAMTLALEARALKGDILVADTPKAQRRKHRLSELAPKGRLWKHSKLSDIDGILSPAELSQMLVFTLVRNPWDRMVSYYHWLREQSFSHPAVQLAKGVGFATFVHDPMTRVSVRENHYATYLRPAKAPVFVRLEHLEQDIEPVATHLGFRPKLPHVNSSARARDWRRYYSDVEIELVAEMCAGDVARFDYSFGAYA